MGLIGVRVNISGGAAFVDLTKALSYITGSVVPSGSTVNLVGVDYDSPHNNVDSATETLYLGFYQTNDMLVSAWRNAFAAHLNSREDLDLMGDLGEFVVGFNTGSIAFPTEDISLDANTESQANAVGNSNYRFMEDGWYNWAPLENATSINYSSTKFSTAPHTTLGSDQPEKYLITYSGIGDIDGVLVGSYTADTTSSVAGTSTGYPSKFAIGGTTAISNSLKTAKISIIDAFNKQNPIPPAEVDVFGNSKDVLPKYGYNRLLDCPMILKVHAANTPAHHTVPMGGVNVMCGLVRLADHWNSIENSSSAPGEAGGASAANHGTLTFWIDGWSEF